MTMRWKEMISAMNDDRVEYVLNIFNSFETFFNVISRDKESIKKLEPINTSWEHYLRKWCLRNDRELFNYFLKDFGVHHRDGSYYYKVGDPKSLSNLFCWGSNGRTDFYSFFDKKYKYFAYDQWGFESDENIFNLYSNLTNENKNLLQDTLLGMFNEHKINICSDKMHEYTSNPKYITLDKNNIKKLLSDYDTFMCILENEAQDVHENLNKILSSVYENLEKNYFVDFVVEQLEIVFDIDKKKFLNLNDESFLKIKDNLLETIEYHDDILYDDLIDFIEHLYGCFERPSFSFNLSFDRKNDNFSKLVVESNKIFKKFFE